MGLNDIIKYLFIGLTITVVCSVSSAYTANGKLTTIPIGAYTYQGVLDHKEEVVYEQLGANVPVKKKINNKEENDNLKSVAGKDIGGYSKLILKKINENTVSIEGDRQEYHSNNEAAELKYIVTGKFVKGNWSDLISNREVKIEFNKEDAPTIKTELKGYLEKVIKSIGNKKLKEMSKGSVFEQIAANKIGAFIRAEVPHDKLKVNMVALEGTKESLKQLFSLDIEFKLHN